MKKQNRSAALRGSRRKTVAAKPSSEDADRDVRGAQMPTELRRWVKRRLQEARRAKRIAIDRGFSHLLAKADGVIDVLAELRTTFPSQPRKASGAANEKLSRCDEKENK